RNARAAHHPRQDRPAARLIRMEHARRATYADVHAMSMMAQKARDAVLQERGGPMLVKYEVVLNPDEDLFARELNDPERAVFAGCIDDVVVGFVVVNLREVTDLGLMGSISELYVEPEARGVGVGEAMLAEVTKFCRDKSCFGIDGMALPGDRATKNFF